MTDDLTKEEKIAYAKKAKKQREYEENFEYKGDYADQHYKHEEENAMSVKDLKNYKPRKVKRTRLPQNVNKVDHYDPNEDDGSSSQDQYKTGTGDQSLKVHEFKDDQNENDHSIMTKDVKDIESANALSPKIIGKEKEYDPMSEVMRQHAQLLRTQMQSFYSSRNMTG